MFNMIPQIPHDIRLRQARNIHEKCLKGVASLRRSPIRTWASRRDRPFEETLVCWICHLDICTFQAFPAVYIIRGSGNPTDQISGNRDLIVRSDSQPGQRQSEYKATHNSFFHFPLSFHSIVDAPTSTYRTSSGAFDCLWKPSTAPLGISRR